VLRQGLVLATGCGVTNGLNIPVSVNSVRGIQSHRPAPEEQPSVTPPYPQTQMSTLPTMSNTIAECHIQWLYLAANGCKGIPEPEPEPPLSHLRWHAWSPAQCGQ
jgi:hypothetical protein